MEKKPTEFDAAIVADGNSKIGMGHIMRCSAIADALTELGLRVCFLHSDGSPTDTVRSLGYDSFLLDSDYRLLSEQGARLAAVLREHRVSFAFFDSYFAANELFAEISRTCRVGCFGYGKNYFSGMDLIVPYGLSSDPEWYRTAVDPEKTRVLLGTDYVPLRRAFWQETDRRTAPTEKRILLTSGGTDPLNVTGNLIRALRSRGITNPLDVVAGRFFDTDSLRAEFGDRTDIRIHQGLTDLSGLMRNAYAAVSAGGTTLYELMACTVPTAAYAMADNQLGNRALDGAVLWCGDIREGDSLSPAALARIADGVGKLLSDEGMRASLIERGLRQCDGRGACRIAEAIRELVSRDS